MQNGVGIVCDNTHMDDTLELERLGRGDQTGLLTIAETAATLRLSEATVWRRIRDGQLEAVRLGAPGSAIRVRVQSVRDLQHPYTEGAPTHA
jgi:excisionase family DNA binding protein